MYLTPTIGTRRWWCWWLKLGYLWLDLARERSMKGIYIVRVQEKGIDRVKGKESFKLGKYGNPLIWLAYFWKLVEGGALAMNPSHSISTPLSKNWVGICLEFHLGKKLSRPDKSTWFQLKFVQIMFNPPNHLEYDWVESARPVPSRFTVLKN